MNKQAKAVPLNPIRDSMLFASTSVKGRLSPTPDRDGSYAGVENLGRPWGVGSGLVLRGSSFRAVFTRQVNVFINKERSNWPSPTPLSSNALIVNYEMIPLTDRAPTAFAIFSIRPIPFADLVSRRESRTRGWRSQLFNEHVVTLT